MPLFRGLALLPLCAILPAAPSGNPTPEADFRRLQDWAGHGAASLGFTLESLKGFLAERAADLSAGRQPAWSTWLKRLETSTGPNLRAWALARRVEAGEYAAYPALQEAITEHLLGISKPGSGRLDRIVTDPPWTASIRMPETLRLNHASVFWRSLRKTLESTPERKLDGGTYAIWCFGTHPDQKDLILDLAAQVQALPTVRNQQADPWNDPRFWIVLDWATVWGTREDIETIRTALKQGPSRTAFDRAITPLSALPGYFPETTPAPALEELSKPLTDAPPAPTAPVHFDFSQIRILEQPSPPRYPEDAKQRKMMTNLIMDIVVDPEGRPVSCRPQPGPWLGFFASTGAAYGLRWRFHPAKLNGAPQYAKFRLTMPFRLKN